MDLKAIIKTNKPNLASSSINTYNSILSNLLKKLDYTDYKDLLKQKKLLAHLKDIKPSNRKTTLSAVVVLFSNDTYKDNKALLKYKKVLKEDSDLTNTEQDKQQKTQKQEDNWIDWKDIKDKYIELENDTKHLFNKSKLSMKDKQELQSFIILSCYVLVEPRRLLDWVEFKVNNIDKSKDNYMNNNNFIFNNYKTKGKYDSQTVAIPKDLKKILTNWIKLIDCDYLFCDSNNNKLTSVKLNQRLNKILGNKASVNIIRHSFLTNKYKDIPALTDMKKTAENMGHSVEEALKYIKK